MRWIARPKPIGVSADNEGDIMNREDRYDQVARKHDGGQRWPSSWRPSYLSLAPTSDLVDA
ncbi:MAG: hypothetical protein ACXU96_16650, partial [Gemmatimonadaceae bacterium]